MTIHHYEHLLDKVRNLRPAYRFDGQWEAEPERWRTEWSAKLVELLGPTPADVDPLDAAAANAQWEQLETHERYTLYRVTYRTEPGLEAFALAAVPHEGHETSETIPGVLHIHGHQRPRGCYPVMGYRKPDEDPDAARPSPGYGSGAKLASQGCVVIAPNLRGFGDRLTDTERAGAERRDPCNVNFFQQMLLGETAVTSQLHDLRIALSILAAHPRVDAQRLACTGMSYGGRLTMFLSAIDHRIRAAAVGGALNSFAERIRSYASCGAQVVPGLLRYADTPEIFGLIAPRPMAIDLGATDGCCPREEGLALFEQIKRIYRAFGCEDRLELFLHDQGHVYQREKHLPWLLRQLAAARPTTAE